MAMASKNASTQFFERFSNLSSLVKQPSLPKVNLSKSESGQVVNVLGARIGKHVVPKKVAAGAVGASVSKPSTLATLIGNKAFKPCTPSKIPLTTPHIDRVTSLCQGRLNTKRDSPLTPLKTMGPHSTGNNHKMPSASTCDNNFGPNFNCTLTNDSDKTEKPHVIESNKDTLTRNKDENNAQNGHIAFNLKLNLDMTPKKDSSEMNGHAGSPIDITTSSPILKENFYESEQDLLRKKAKDESDEQIKANMEKLNNMFQNLLDNQKNLLESFGQVKADTSEIKHLNHELISFNTKIVDELKAAVKAVKNENVLNNKNTLLYEKIMKEMEAEIEDQPDHKEEKIELQHKEEKIKNVKGKKDKGKNKHVQKQNEKPTSKVEEPVNKKDELKEDNVQELKENQKEEEILKQTTTEQEENLVSENVQEPSDEMENLLESTDQVSETQIVEENQTLQIIELDIEQQKDGSQIIELRIEEEKQEVETIEQIVDDNADWEDDKKKRKGKKGKKEEAEVITPDICASVNEDEDDGKKDKKSKGKAEPKLSKKEEKRLKKIETQKSKSKQEENIDEEVNESGDFEDASTETPEKKPEKRDTKSSKNVQLVMDFEQEKEKEEGNQDKKKEDDEDWGTKKSKKSKKGGKNKR